jgi:uncharacterized protein with GYD domain
MALGKYTPSGLAGVRKDGYGSREQGLQKWAASVGGTLECMYFMSSGDWDFVAIASVDSDAMFAVSSQGGASGAFERMQVHELRSGDEADGLIGRAGAWKPPSSS